MENKEEEKKILMDKEYSWESCNDIEEDVYWELQKLPGEFEGTIRIIVEYLEDR